MLRVLAIGIIGISKTRQGKGGGTAKNKAKVVSAFEVVNNASRSMSMVVKQDHYIHAQSWYRRN